jgi:hypothetical protein
MEPYKELFKLAGRWIGLSYKTIHKDLSNRPIITISTILLLSGIAVGLSYGGLMIHNEFNRKDSVILFDHLNNDEN